MIIKKVNHLGRVRVYDKRSKVKMTFKFKIKNLNIKNLKINNIKVEERT